MKTMKLTLGILVLSILSLSAQTAVNTSTRGTNAYYGGGGYIKPAGLTPALPGGQQSWFEVGANVMGKWIDATRQALAPKPAATPAGGEAQPEIRKN